VAELFARLSTERAFVAQMRRIWGRPSVTSDLSAMWALLARDRGTRNLPAIMQYVHERTRFRRRWIGALERLDLPALIAWGKKDPVCQLPIAEQLAKEIPNAELLLWDDLGHYPQVEAPDIVARAVASFWDKI
jgi:pimeloyl-ACP methyl ester carboxylesterase